MQSTLGDLDLDSGKANIFYEGLSELGYGDEQEAILNATWGKF